MAQDLRLAPMLDTLRASGRQVFLATNSLFDYTHIVMVRTGLKFHFLINFQTRVLWLYRCCLKAHHMHPSCGTWTCKSTVRHGTCHILFFLGIFQGGRFVVVDPDLPN